MEEEVTPLEERSIFESNGVKYIYDFNLLDIEQVEIAKEIGLFKEDQRARGTDNINDLFKSRSIDYLPILLSFLLLEVKDGQVQAFNRDLAEMKTQPFIKSLKAKDNYSRLVECANDFFTNAGMQQSVSMILAGKKPQKSMQELLTEMMLTKALTTPKSNGN